MSWPSDQETSDNWAAGSRDGWHAGQGSCSGCGETGHENENCPHKHIEGGDSDGNDKCFNCCEPGHLAADCPTPRDMNCRYCKQPGHMIRDCPDKPPMVCDNCGEEGHMRKNCENARKINRDHIADVSPEDAIAKLKAAASERDADDAKEGVQEYVKAMGGEVKYRDLQSLFIAKGIPLWLIATERKLINVFTNMDLQGNTGKKYSISYRFSETPERPREAEHWPEDRDDILNRLDDAGDIVDTGLRKCGNCGELGHSSKFCTEEKVEKEVVKIECSNCGGEGHRIRDCPEPRVDRFACRNCGQSGHKASECEEPPNMDNVECRKCNEKGHFAKDCPQGGGRACRNCGKEDHIAKECTEPPNLDNVTCRNCEKTGHFSRDCPEPKDWSKVQCSNCQQYGHTKVKCRQPPSDSVEFGAPQDTGAASTGPEKTWASEDGFSANPEVAVASLGW